MMFWAAIVCAAFLQQPVDEPSKQLEALKKENAELRERLTQFDQSSVEDAQLIHRLRQLVKVLQEKTAALESVSKGSGTPAPGTAERPKTDGPEKPLKGKVVYVDVKSGFLTLGIGKREGVKVGFKFEIYREIADASGELRMNRLGMGEVEKFMGQDSMAKLIVKEGNTADMKADDVAVAIRRLDPVAPAGTPAAGPPVAAPIAEPKDGVYAITGSAGTAFILNFGGLHGARQTDLVYVYAGGQLKAKLRLDRVEKNFSVANVVDGSIVTPPSVGDQVVTREPHKVLSGKVALSDDKRGVLAVDLRQRDGVKTGMKLEARRLGQKIGVLVVLEVQSWGSWCKPEGESKIEDFKKGDFVEALEEK